MGNPCEFPNCFVHIKVNLCGSFLHCSFAIHVCTANGHFYWICVLIKLTDKKKSRRKKIISNLFSIYMRCHVIKSQHRLNHCCLRFSFASVLFFISILFSCCESRQFWSDTKLDYSSSSSSSSDTHNQLTS